MFYFWPLCSSLCFEIQLLLGGYITRGQRSDESLSFSVVFKNTILLKAYEWEKIAVKPVIPLSAFYIFHSLSTRKYKDPLSHFQYMLYSITDMWIWH